MAQPRILFVDDELDALEPVTKLLRRRYDVTTASDADGALERVKLDPPFAVVLSDLDMPGRDGIALFKELQVIAPQSVRLLLTGNTRLEAAITAVNQGQIFRFLQKPCPPDLLLGSLQAGVAQFELIRSEQILLEQTLHGSVDALVGVLALAVPTAFGRVDRLKTLVAELAGAVAIPQRWEVEVASMLVEVGSIGLPPALTDKLASRSALTDAEARLANERAAIAARIIGSIPRLEGVRLILENVGLWYEPPADQWQPVSGEQIPIGSRVLAVALDYDDLESHGMEAGEALRILRGRRGRYDRNLLSAIALLREQQLGDDVILEVPLTEVVPGMVFVEDVRSAADGTLMISRGQQVTASLVSRIQNYWTDIPINGPVRVTKG